MPENLLLKKQFSVVGIGVVAEAFRDDDVAHTQISSPSKPENLLIVLRDAQDDDLLLHAWAPILPAGGKCRMMNVFRFIINYSHALYSFMSRLPNYASSEIINVIFHVKAISPSHAPAKTFQALRVLMKNVKRFHFHRNRNTLDQKVPTTKASSRSRRRPLPII